MKLQNKSFLVKAESLRKEYRVKTRKFLNFLYYFSYNKGKYPLKYEIYSTTSFNLIDNNKG